MPLNNNRNAAIVALDGILRKQNQYDNDIKKITANLNVFAEIISISGAVETSLLNDGEGDNLNDHEEILTFMNEQRSKLKDITERNIKSKRFVNAYMAAAESLRSDIVHHVSEEDEDASAIDYETMLQTKIEFEKHNIEKNSIAIKDEDFMRKVRQNLNEKDTTTTNDDDIEIEVTQNSIRESEFKCPLTGMFFTDPYRNKVCHHVYDKVGIQKHLTMKSDCPIMGCRNRNVSWTQLESDEEMKIKVQRFLRTQKERQRRNAMSQDYDVEDDEEEEYDGGNNDHVGMTLIE